MLSNRPHLNNSNLGLAALGILSLLLVACTGNKGDDLDEFIENSGKDMRQKIEPLPEVKAYIPLEFNANGDLPDPFKARKPKSNNTSVLQPDLNRPKEPLESFSMDTLKFAGTIEKDKIRVGLIRTPEGNIQQVKVGNYIGQNFGIVTSVTETGAVVKEIVQDEITGDWVERTVNLDLQE